jgi:hypothetical protein
MLTQNSEKTVMANTANLKPFPKGVSGNPGGRPRKVLAERLLRKLLENDEATAEALIASLIEKAKTGDVAAFNSIRDMVDGKPVQRLEESGPDESAIQRCITVTFVSPVGEEKR